MWRDDIEWMDNTTQAYKFILVETKWKRQRNKIQNKENKIQKGKIYQKKKEYVGYSMKIS